MDPLWELNALPLSRSTFTAWTRSTLQPRWRDGQILHADQGGTAQDWPTEHSARPRQERFG
jgi:hypothetical protein